MMITTLLSIAIALFVLYAVYDEFLMMHLKGKTKLKVYLKNTHKIDGIIFIGLILLIAYQYILSNENKLTGLLLSFLLLISCYCFLIRRPKLLFKQDGFFYANVFVPYQRIQTMNLTENGALVIKLEQKEMIIWVRKMDDLEKIYNTLIAS